MIRRCAVALWLALWAVPAAAQEDGLFAGVVVGGGPAYSPEASERGWNGTLGMRFHVHQGVMVVPAQFSVLLARLPPGGMLLPDFVGGIGIAPLGPYGPHLAAQVGFGFGIAVIEANYGAIAGFGGKAYVVDFRIRRGFRWPPIPNRFMYLGVEVGVMFPMEL